MYTTRNTNSEFHAPIMLMMSTSDVLNPQRLCAAVEDMAEKGFDTVCMEFRNSIYDEYDSLGKSAMETVCRHAKQCGLHTVKTIPASLTGAVKKNPDIRRRLVTGYETKLEGNEFSLRIAALQTGVLVRIKKIFLLDGNVVSDVTETTQCRLEMDAEPVIYGHLQHTDAILYVYVEYETDEIDYACGDVEQYLRELCTCYDGLALDGMALDEFGAGSRMEHVYLSGTSFLDYFRKAYGYDLLDKIYLLDQAHPGFAKVRYDYFALTGELTYRFQAIAKKIFEEKYGENIFIGFHSTWWGEGNSGDLWAGNIDYFHLTENLSGGFVDAQYDAQRTMLSMTALAESLAKYSKTGTAYNMCWDRYPTHEKMDYYHRYLAMRNVRWVAHGYGNTGIFGPGYPMHSTWADAKMCTHMEKSMQEFLQGAQSKPKIALMYLWQGLAYRNDDRIHYHRLSLKAMLEKFQLAHLEVDVIPDYEENLSQYEVLFVLWPVMMPKATWERLQALARTGKKLIFIGPPARVTTDGEEIGDAFCAMTGCRPGEPAEFTGEYEYVAWDLWFTQEKIPMLRYPVENTTGKLLYGQTGDVIGVEHNNIVYYPFEIPLTKDFQRVLDGMREYQTIQVPNALSKVLYAGEDSILTLAAIWQEKINAKFQFAGMDISIQNGTLIGIKHRQGQTIQVLANREAVVSVQGKPIDITYFYV